MLGKLLDMVPNVFGAAVIGFAGWLVAKVLRGAQREQIRRARAGAHQVDGSAHHAARRRKSGTGWATVTW